MIPKIASRKGKKGKPALYVFLSPHCPLRCSCLPVLHIVPLNLGLHLSINTAILFCLWQHIYCMISCQKPFTLLLPKCTGTQHNWAFFLQAKLPAKPRAALGARGMLAWLWGAWITSLCVHSTEPRVTSQLEKHFLHLMQRNNRSYFTKICAGDIMEAD